jgi:histidinol-phosphatase (PHP family)
MTATIPFDYHMHSTNSCDCRAPMADMCREAIRKGIPEIAFTEHLDRQPGDYCYDQYDPEQFFRDIEACRAEFGPQGLTIKAGIEVGEMHLFRAEVEPVLNSYPYDLVLGSLHWNQGESIFERDYFLKREPQDVARDYFTELTELVNSGGFNIMSHMDVFKRVGYSVHKRFDIAEWEEYVRPVFAACIRRGIAPEINTSALRMPIRQTHPTVEAIRWYREMGGELLSIGSDSHTPHDLGFGLDQAIAIAKEAGFTHLTRFAGRKVVDFVPI